MQQFRWCWASWTWFSCSILLWAPVESSFSRNFADLEQLLAITARKAEEKVDQMLSRCYGDYGCFSVGGKFVSIARPVNLFPFPPDMINTKMLLYTRLNQKRPLFLTPNDVSGLNRTHFNTTMDTKVIIHGFLESGQQSWCHKMKDELLVHDNFNVIIMDWMLGALPPYTQAVANARLVGAIAAKFFELLRVRYEYSPQKAHIIGHSLGAHVAGYAGSRLGDLGRISGLDPAGPYFEGTDPVVRLDPSDADFVDVIHTDGSSLLNKAFGMYNPSGHVDFYPNGGVEQPGCEDNMAEALQREDMNIYRGIRHWVACRHVRSHEYFTESINSPCSFRGYECNSYDEFLAGHCVSCGHNSRSCALMGFHAISYMPNVLGTLSLLRFFLKTNADSPFCTHHQLVTVHTAKRRLDSDNEPMSGILMMQIEDDKVFETTRLNTREMSFEPQTTYSTVVSSRMPGPFQKIRLQMIQPPQGFTEQLARIFQREPQLEIDSIDVDNLETGDKSTFCIGPSNVLTKGSAVTLQPSLKCRR